MGFACEGEVVTGASVGGFVFVSRGGSSTCGNWSVASGPPKRGLKVHCDPSAEQEYKPCVNRLRFEEYRVTRSYISRMKIRSFAREAAACRSPPSPDLIQAQ